MTPRRNIAIGCLTGDTWFPIVESRFTPKFLQVCLISASFTSHVPLALPSPFHLEGASWIHRSPKYREASCTASILIIACGSCDLALITVKICSVY